MCVLHKNICVSILSTDRPKCLQRLLQSIQDYTVLEDLTVLVVDDSSDQGCMIKEMQKEFPWILIWHTGERIGIARNTNKALWAMNVKEWEYRLILNDDVEVLSKNWEYLYPNAMKKSGFHHMCFQQMGLWGAGTNKRPQTIQLHSGIEIRTIQDCPQGSVLALDSLAFDTAGFFDSDKFHSYGKSHWMWSFSISESDIQPKGIHDLKMSNDYFKVHDEICTTPSEERIASYQRNTKIFQEEFEKLKNGTRKIYTKLV